MMWPFSKGKPDAKYEEISTLDGGDDSHIYTKRQESKTRRALKGFVVAAPWGIVILLAILYLWHRFSWSMQFQNPCKQIEWRQEWRQLTPIVQSNYLDAVQCLYSTPSMLHPGDTLRDDFAWVHMYADEYGHMDSHFASWHRYFLHIYEMKLRECGYSSPIPYWDWTIDRANLSHAPIWDSFGGDGNRANEQLKTLGYCVDGDPFLGYESRYWLKHIYQHCLTRRFDVGQEEQYEFNLRPEAMEELFAQKSHEEFGRTMRDSIHDTIPSYIGGDFYWFTAPNDPVFFLHHAQLDRLWWLWQQSDPSRVTDYGYSGHNSSKKSSVDDLMPMLGLAPDLSVSSVMDTMSGILCYHY